jgi:hypothetical protein
MMRERRRMRRGEEKKSGKEGVVWRTANPRCRLGCNDDSVEKEPL